MSWLGSPTTIQCSGISNNAVLDLNATDVSMQLPINLNDNFVIDRYVLPNSEIDWVGPRNRRISVKGFVDTNSATTGKIRVSGLEQLSETGSYSCWFYDEALCQHRGTSGLWVRPENIRLERSTNNTRAKHQVGYVINYDLSLVETVR